MDKEAGERLKKIRADKGIGLEEVAERTKVPLNILRAIEEGEFINLEPVYINGFIKIYCKYLGIDPSDFIKGLQKPQVTMKLSDEEEKAITFCSRWLCARVSVEIRVNCRWYYWGAYSFGFNWPRHIQFGETT